MSDEDSYTITGGPLKPHEWVRIRREITAADEAAVQNAGMMGTGTKKNPQVQMLMGSARLVLVKRMVLAWQLTRTVVATNGQESEVAVELSEKAIDSLSRKRFNYIYDAINKLNDDDDEESAEDFSPAANGHSEGSLETMSLFPAKD